MHTSAKTFLVALVSICATVVVMLLIWTAVPDKPLLPDHPPDGVEENAVLDTDNAEKMAVPSGGSGLSIEYANEVTIDLTSGTAALYFKNAGKSLENAVLSLVIRDTVILQTDLLPPGATVTALPLPEQGVPLQEGTYHGVFILQLFGENSEAALLNSRIENITVTVK